jgi:hypothetical protein
LLNIINKGFFIPNKKMLYENENDKYTLNDRENSLRQLARKYRKISD